MPDFSSEPHAPAPSDAAPDDYVPHHATSEAAARVDAALDDLIGGSYQIDTASPALDEPALEHAAPPVIERQDEPGQPWKFRLLLLYLATCCTTFAAYYAQDLSPTTDPASCFHHSLIYACGVMFILTAHELGHFFQAVRYRVPTTLPIFIPMPIGPIGTMGAVIGLRGHMGDRKALFDIGISGPLAGLVPTLIFAVLGLHWSTFVPDRIMPDPDALFIGFPPVMNFISHAVLGPTPPGYGLELHPLAYAGWVGILLTSLNLFPIGQLDGGHILYAILRRKAHVVAEVVLFASIAGVVLYEKWMWSLILVMLIYMGPRHPSTANDDAPLGIGRVILGILTLLFLLIGFTPDPFFPVR